MKDLLLQKWMLILFVFPFSFFWRTKEVYFTGSLLGYMLVILIAGSDGGDRSDILLNSFPIPKWKIVGAKYLSTLIYGVIVSLIIFLLSLGLYTPSANLTKFLLRIASVATMSSLYWPIHFALGYAKARYWNFLVFFAVSALFPLADFALESLPADTLRGDMILTFVIAGVVAIMMGVSFWLSIRFYGRRDF